MRTILSCFIVRPSKEPKSATIVTTFNVQSKTRRLLRSFLRKNRMVQVLKVWVITVTSIVSANRHSNESVSEKMLPFNL